MKTITLSAAAAIFALAAPVAQAEDCARTARTADSAVQLAQAAPQQSRPGPSEQGGQRTNEPGTAAAPTSMSGAPAGAQGMRPMPSTMSGATPPTPSQMNTPQQTRPGAAEQGGQRANDPGTGVPATGSAVTPPSAAMQGQPTGSQTPPGSTTTNMPSQTTAPQQSRPGAAEQGAQRSNDPGTATPPTTRTQ